RRPRIGRPDEAGDAGEAKEARAPQDRAEVARVLDADGDADGARGRVLRALGDGAEDILERTPGERRDREHALRRLGRGDLVPERGSDRERLDRARPRGVEERADVVARLDARSVEDLLDRDAAREELAHDLDPLDDELLLAPSAASREESAR